MREEYIHFEEQILEGVNETESCSVCGRGHFKLLHVDYGKGDGLAYAIFSCRNCGKVMDINYMHPNL